MLSQHKPSRDSYGTDGVCVRGLRPSARPEIH